MQTTGADVVVNDVYVDPANSQHVLLATDRQGVLASDDGGDSFLPSNRGFSARQVTAYSADAQHAATLYVGVVNDKESGGVFVSHTGGLSWSQMSGGLDGHDVFSLGQAPDGSILAGTEHGIYRLQGAVWQRVGDDTKIAVEGKTAAAGAKTAAAGKTSAGKRQAAKRQAPARGAVAAGAGKRLRGERLWLCDDGRDAVSRRPRRGCCAACRAGRHGCRWRRFPWTSGALRRRRRGWWRWPA